MNVDEMVATAMAINRAEAAADPDWDQYAFAAVWIACHRQEFFSVDKVWDELARIAPNATTHENRAMGAIIRRARREGWIVGTGRYEPSEREGCHGHPRQIWQSIIYEAPVA